MYCDWPLLGRCCFCLPLRQGILTFGYIHSIVTIFMIGIHSYSIHIANQEPELLPDLLASNATVSNLKPYIHDNNPAEIAEGFIHGREMVLPSEALVFLYIMELIFDGLLIYSVHMKIVRFLEIYYYYTLTTCVALLIMELTGAFAFESKYWSPFEIIIFAFTGLCLQLYLMTLVRSLMRKLQISGPHVNQLHEYVNGEANITVNAVYSDTTVVPEDY